MEPQREAVFPPIELLDRIPLRGHAGCKRTFEFVDLLVIGGLLVLVLLLHLRACLVSGLLLGICVSLALLPSAADGAHRCAYRSARSGISGDPADDRASDCATSRTPGSSAFGLRCGFSCLSLCRLDVGRTGCLGSCHLRINAGLLLR